MPKLELHCDLFSLVGSCVALIDDTTTDKKLIFRKTKNKFYKTLRVKINVFFYM